MQIPHLTPLLPAFLTRYPWLREFVYFGFKQAWACVFGGLLLLGIVATGLWYPDVALARYDFLFLYAVAIQLALLVFRLESWREVGVIAVFHAMATAMELFKTSEGIGSWSYPEDSLIRIGNLPLFAGFMYGAVGSYMARAWQYPNQSDGWRMVHHSKFTAWYLLMQLSFILIVALRRLEARLADAKLLPGSSGSA